MRRLYGPGNSRAGPGKEFFNRIDPEQSFADATSMPRSCRSALPSLASIRNFLASSFHSRERQVSVPRPISLAAYQAAKRRMDPARPVHGWKLLSSRPILSHRYRRRNRKARIGIGSSRRLKPSTLPIFVKRFLDALYCNSHRDNTIRSRRCSTSRLLSC